MFTSSIDMNPLSLTFSVCVSAFVMQKRRKERVRYLTFENDKEEGVGGKSAVTPEDPLCIGFWW